LKHPFIQKARKTAHLSELIERYKRWRAARAIDDTDSDNDDDMLVYRCRVILCVFISHCLVKLDSFNGFTRVQ